MRPDIHDQARGKWRGILATLGVPQEFLKDKHGPCPLCGGKDRFRWDNKEGRGTYVCGQCGAGSGLDLLMKYRGFDFKEAVSEIRDVLGVVDVEPPKPEMTEEARRARLRELWKASQPMVKGDLAHRYFETRGIEEDYYSPNLRFAPRCWFSDGVYYPALLGVVSDQDGRPVTLHRTYLAHDGSGKAPVDEPRRMMPGKIPAGACIRLGEAGESLGIAEGIETAMAAMQMYDLPVWSAINSTMLAKWEPPACVEEVTIFGDNDSKFGGQKAAYELAHRLAVRGLTVSVKFPDEVGFDFADELKRAAA